MATIDAPPSASDDIAALERFVCDNDELIELESEVGRFNVFDALGVVRQEIRHSNFLAWLLDPAESHGQGHLFVRAVLMDLLRRAPIPARPLSPVDIDGAELSSIEIRREWKNLDLLILLDNPPAVIAIENKIDASEHSDQLDRYESIVRQAFPGRRSLFVYLTPDRSEPSNDQWIAYSYSDLYSALSRCLRLHEESIGDEVAVILRHYLTVVRSRLMNDPKIADLCERIYKNHRQAIDLIIEHRPDPRAMVSAAFARALESDEQDWLIEVSAKGRAVYFLPREWLNWLPPLRAKPPRGSDPRTWVWMYLELGDTWIQLKVYFAPTTDAQFRARLIETLQHDGASSGFKIRSPRPGDQWTTVYSERVMTSKSGIDYADEVIEKVLKAFGKLKDKAPAMGRTLKNFVDVHRPEVK